MDETAEKRREKVKEGGVQPTESVRSGNATRTEVTFSYTIEYTHNQHLCLLQSQLLDDNQT